MANLGVVKSITGIVKAIAENGAERILSVGDSVAENERIITGDGEVVIALSDGTEKELGNNSSIVLNEAAQQDALDDVAAIQAALANNPNFDPSDLPATAAGNAAAAGGEANERHSIVSVDYLNPQMEPFSGFETASQVPEFPISEVNPDELLQDLDDTLDSATVVLTATESNSEDGGSIVYTSSLIDNDGGEVITTDAITETLANDEAIIIAAGESPHDSAAVAVNLEGVDDNDPDIVTAPTTAPAPTAPTAPPFDAVIAEEPNETEGLEGYATTLPDSAGGNYESLNLSKATATTTVLDIRPCMAYLTVNTSNTGGGGETGIQNFDITITGSDGSGSKTAATDQAEEGQQDIAREFDGEIVFAAGQTYTVVMEHTGGSAHTNVTDFTLVDKLGNEIILNDKGGNDNTTITEGDDSNYDGIIYTIHIDAAGIDTGYTVDPVVGYDVTADQTLYLGNPISGQNDISIDFGDLSLNDDSNDIFGHIQTIDISGSGKQEDNTISLSAQDVIELGDGLSDITININGDVGDTVNLVDQDGESGGTWTKTGAEGGQTTYTYADGGVVEATAIIDNALYVDMNTASLDGF